MNHDELMRGLTIQHLRFTALPEESIVFDAQAGSALRGALYQALSENFCSEPGETLTPDHQQRCPVCWLLAAEDPAANRGRNIPRALTVEPPLGKIYHRDQPFTFGLTLIGQAQNLFPYLARAVQKMGQIGVGKGRGRFRLAMISEYSPLLDAKRDLMDGTVVRRPTLQITPARIVEAAEQGQPNRITLELLTPLRLTAAGQLVKRPEPSIFMARLLERCQSIVNHYAEAENCPPREAWLQAAQIIMAAAAELQTAYDDTRWVEAWSGSRRKQAYTPISGLVGSFRWEGPVDGLRPWLLWGQSLHVGKDAIKGNGWYRVVG